MSRFTAVAPPPLTMLLIHLPVPPWRQDTPDALDLVLLTDDAAPDAVFVRGLPDNEEHLVPMAPDGRDGALHRWRARLPWDAGNPATRYAFKLVADGTQHWLAADGAHPHVPPQALHFRVHRHERPPAWVRQQFFYQVFPDRFARGAPPVDRHGERLWGGDVREVVQPAWGAPVDPAHGPNAFYGGDLPGLQAALPYLNDELGVTALYLNPVFRAGSNHRYDTESYDEVDPHLGGNAALASLRQATAARGMRLVLDAVINHTGANHPWFNRWGQHPGPGAAQSPQSPWRRWYAFGEDGRPVGWKGHDSLPVLDFAEPAVREALVDGPDSVLRRWLRPPYALDGWRLDVVHMLGEGPGAHRNAHHVQGIRRAIRAENPEGYVLGEHFFEATDWLQGDQEDGAMNYHGFGHPVRAWLAGRDLAGHPVRLSTPDFARWLVRATAVIPWDNQLAQLNLLGSHDTPRFLTLLGGDVPRMALALTLLFTWPGVPCVYYGDEIGLEGGPDPDCRRCFEPDRGQWNLTLLETVRALAALRRDRADWQDGGLLMLQAGDDHLAFARVAEGAWSVVVANRGPQAVPIAVPLDAVPGAAAGAPGRLAHGSGLSRDGGWLRGTLGPGAAAVWVSGS